MTAIKFLRRRLLPSLTVAKLTSTISPPQNLTTPITFPPRHVTLIIRALVTNLIKPPRLRPGDTVGVIALASAVEQQHLERGVDALVRLGYKVKVSDAALHRSSIFAGRDEERVSELMSFMADSEVRAIFAARGGYGSGRLLPAINYEALAKSPKILLGFSDETFLLNAIVERCRMVCFHGPMVAMDFARGLSDASLNHLRALLAGELNHLELDAPHVIAGGTAEGTLIGGCLSVLVSMLGTPYAPSFFDKILFLEDIGEKPYRIDRMLVQLRQAGALERVKGIVFGGMVGVEGSDQERLLTTEFMAEQTGSLGCPVLSGLEAGHRTQNFALPLGVRARIDSSRHKLIFLEQPVT